MAAAWRPQGGWRPLGRAPAAAEAAEGDLGDGFAEEAAEDVEAGEAPLTEEALDAELQDFITKWGLQTDAQQLLLTLDAEAQLKVVREFSPRDTARDANAIFVKFAQGVAARTPQKRAAPAAAGRGGGLADPAVGAFVKQWQLGPEAQGVLLALDAAARARVMAEFAPRDAARDANSIFIKFAQGVCGGMPRGGGGKGLHKMQAAYAGPPLAHPAGPPRLLRPPVRPGFGKGGKAPAWPAAGPPAPAPRAAARPPAPAHLAAQVAEFAEHWQLTEASTALLQSFDLQAQAKVMAEFSPRDASRDVNAIFAKFAQGVGSREQRASSVQTFLAQWSLGPEAQQLFFGLPPLAQQRVMQEFRPRDASSDCNNIFMKFAQGVCRSMGAAAFPAAFAGAGRYAPY